MADDNANKADAQRTAADGQTSLLSISMDVVGAVFAFLGETAALTWQCGIAAVTGGLNAGDIVNQMAAVGADSIWIVLLVTTATGAVFSYYLTSLTQQIGFTGFVGGVLGYGFLNELGPVLGGVALAARAGAAIAAEIGSMVVTEQVDALRAMAVSPIRYLVLPRVIAAVVMLPMLTIIADFTGMVGGSILAGTRGVPFGEFISSVHRYTHADDLIRGLIKAVVFGYMIGIVACQQGLRTTGGATGVGRATTTSVALCVALIFVVDFFLTQMLTTLVNIPH